MFCTMPYEDIHFIRQFFVRVFKKKKAVVTENLQLTCRFLSGSLPLKEGPVMEIGETNELLTQDPQDKHAQQLCRKDSALSLRPRSCKELSSMNYF